MKSGSENNISKQQTQPKYPPPVSTSSQASTKKRQREDYGDSAPPAKKLRTEKYTARAHHRQQGRHLHHPSYQQRYQGDRQPPKEYSAAP